jgi:predicted Fe-Mo cluster-binding NifX family protein
MKNFSFCFALTVTIICFLDVIIDFIKKVLLHFFRASIRVHVGYLILVEEERIKRMKLCIPIEEDKGFESIPYGHFGSAAMFMVFDTESNETKIIDNRDQHHAHGACHPLKNLDGENIDAVLVGGIGSKAISRLNEIGIKVYRSTYGTIKENINHYRNKGLTELTPANACRHHGHGCGN